MRPLGKAISAVTQAAAVILVEKKIHRLQRQLPHRNRARVGRGKEEVEGGLLPAITQE
jgi:hypothetical protein